jgi:UDP-N-acetylmuramate--alanine ligase
MGISGAGMSALASIACRRGVAVTGCDTDPSGALDVAALGATVLAGHDPAHVNGVRAVVVTAAVRPDHPELARARSLGIPVVPRKAALAELVAGRTLVAAAGTHGKTTTTVMATEALTAAGLEPTGLAGGRVSGWGGNALLAGDALFVVEADEYDQAFLTLHPTVAIVNNVEADHLECYGTVAALEAAFGEFAGRAETVLVGADDPGARRVAAALGREVWTFGVAADASFRIGDVRQEADLTSAAVTHFTVATERFSASTASSPAPALLWASRVRRMGRVRSCLVGALGVAARPMFAGVASPPARRPEVAVRAMAGPPWVANSSATFAACCATCSGVSSTTPFGGCAKPSCVGRSA